MEQQFERGQLILARFKTECDQHYLWLAYQYMGENETDMFILGGYLEKTEYEILPFEGNEHLLGTRNGPAPKWEPKPDELVAVTDSLEETWRARRFFARNETLFFCYREKGLETEGWLFCEPLRDHFNVPD